MKAQIPVIDLSSALTGNRDADGEAATAGRPAQLTAQLLALPDRQQLASAATVCSHHPQRAWRLALSKSDPRSIRRHLPDRERRPFRPVQSHTTLAVHPHAAQPGRVEVRRRRIDGQRAREDDPAAAARVTAGAGASHKHKRDNPCDRQPRPARHAADRVA